MGNMNTVAALDITAIGAISTELNKADDIINTAKTKIDNYYTDIADIDDTTELWDNTNKRFQVVRDAMLNAQNLIDNNLPGSGTDAFDILGNAETAYNAIDANLADAETVLGSKMKEPCEIEKQNLLGMRRSIVAKKSISKGTLINEEIVNSTDREHEKFIDVDPERFVIFYQSRGGSSCLG